jgi:hypothetical protein
MIRRLAIPLVLTLLATPAAAQSRDFLFSHPRVSLGVRFGMAAPTANSDIFDFTAEEFWRRGTERPVERSDFHAFSVEGELAVRAHDRVDVALGVGHNRSETPSESAKYMGTDDLPIYQRTEFARTSITFGAKGFLRARGRSISRFAWVPYGWAPYLSAGAGLMAYEFTQAGEFVDFETLDVYNHTYASDGLSPAAYAGAGLELSLGRRLLATTEARYLWARSELDDVFRGFDEIDLSGGQLTLGLAFRF